jgi:hypothetical protein
MSYLKKLNELAGRFVEAFEEYLDLVLVMYLAFALMLLVVGFFLLI